MIWTEIFGWLPEENVELLRRLIVDNDVQSVIEVGAFVGKSTAFFASLVDEVISIEPFDGPERSPYLKKAMRQWPRLTQRQVYDNHLRDFDNITTFETTSLNAAITLPNLTADLIYLDGSHELVDVKADLELWAPRANKVICGDDYSSWWPGVVEAVDTSGLAVNTDQRLWYSVVEGAAR